MEQLLTTQDVATYLNINVATVLREAERGKLKSIKVGRLRRYRPTDVEAYVKAQEAEPTPSGKGGAFAPKVKYTPGMKLVSV